MIKDNNSFGKIIKEMVYKIENPGTNYIPERGFRMSSASYPCDRQIQLRHRPNLYLDPIIIQMIQDIATKRYSGVTPMVIGSLVHEYIQAHLSAKAEEEVRIDQGVLLTGHYDLLLTIDDMQVVCDIKTSKEYARNYLPVQGHLDQIMLYMGALSVSNGVLLYIMRDTGDIVPIDIEFDEEHYDRLIERFKMIQKSEDDRILLPTFSPQNNGFPCVYCEWVDYCFGKDGDVVG